MKRVVYWNPHLPALQRRALYERLGITGGMTVNGESVATTDDTDFLAELERRYYICIRNK